MTVVSSVTNTGQDTLTRVLRFSFSNPLVPDKTYDYDMRTRQLTCLREKSILGKPEFDTRQYIVERDTAVSSDQTHVPVTVIRRRDMARDSKYVKFPYSAKTHLFIAIQRW